MAKRAKKGRCVYCGTVAALTRDHVPPRALFASPRPTLVTVPACRNCHEPANLDDEYFVSRVALREETSGIRNAAEARTRFFRSLSRPDKVGWRDAFARTVRSVPSRSRGGIYLGRRPAYDVDLERLGRVVERTVRGLYWHRKRTPLDPDVVVESFSEEGLRDLDADGLASIGGILTPLVQAPSTAIGDGRTFRFWFLEVPETPAASAWLLEFYESTRFLALTLPERVVAEVRARSELADDR